MQAKLPLKMLLSCLSNLVNFTIVIDNMRAHGYGEAANMSDIHRSVQSSTRERDSNSAIVFAISGLQSYLAHCCSDYIKITEHLLRFDRDFE